MKKVLVTGANGFIGKALFSELKKTHEVYGYTRQDGNISFIDFKEFPVNVDYNFDYIYHLCSTVHNYHIFDDPYLDINTNCIGTVALLENIRKYCPNVKLVYVSTFFINDEQPLALYGATKLCAEHICKSYSRVFNINVSIARLCNVYGIGEQRNNTKKNAFMRILFDLINNQNIEIYDINSYRDMIYIDDVISALTTIAEKGENNEVYMVSTGQLRTFKEIVQIIKTNIPTKSQIGLIKPPLFHQQVGIDTFNNDNSKLCALGWKPQFSLEMSIKQIYERYLEEKCIK